MIDYVSSADRLGISLAAKRVQANAYLDQNYISVLRHGFTPTPSHATDIKATMDRRHPNRVTQRDTPMFLRRQAA